MDQVGDSCCSDQTPLQFCTTVHFGLICYCATWWAGMGLNAARQRWESISDCYDLQTSAEAPGFGSFCRVPIMGLARTLTVCFTCPSVTAEPI